MRWPERIGRYEVKELLGTGSTAEVLRGIAADGAEVALKCVLVEHRADEVATEVLLGEGRLLARIAHPNVVALVEIIEGKPPALALERLIGRTLAEIVASSKIERDLALEIGVQTADALAAVHAATSADGTALGAVHRDVSPDNLFVTQAGVVKLFDFNVAFTSAHHEAPAPGSLQGRVAYMSPEQARSELVDAHADVFSLGAVLWELLVGERLFWRGNTMSTLRALLDEPAPLASSRVDVPLGVDRLLAESLSPRASDRPSAAQFAERLREIVSDDPQRRARLGVLAKI